MGSASITALLLAQAVQAAPGGLTAVISAGAVQKVGTAVVVKALTMTTMQKALVATTIAVAVGVGIYEATQVSRLKGQLRSVANQQGVVDAQLAQLQQERDEANRKLQSAQAEVQRLLKVAADVPRLRGEVARFNSAGAEASKIANDPEAQAALSWSTRVRMLKQKLEEMPDKKIPELALLTEQDWFVAAKEANLESEADFRQAFAGLRNTAKVLFGDLLRDALRQYVQANDGLLPKDVSELQPYINKPMDKAAFDRYKMLRQGKQSDVPGNESLVAERGYVDADFDTHHEISVTGRSVSGVNRDTQLVEGLRMAVDAFKQANNGKWPTTAQELVPYYPTPVTEDMIKRFFPDTTSKSSRP